jgi:hypothetical protein
VPEIPSFVKDATYVAIGFGVLGFQRAQVQRRELAGAIEDHVKLVEERLEAASGQLRSLLGS